MASKETDFLARLQERAASRELKVAVVGLGYVGLPLAVRFASAGYQVTGFDVDARKVAALARGESYIDDVPAAAVRSALEAGRFQATTDAALLSGVDSISICVPTPLSKFREPDLSAVRAAGEELARRLRPGQLVVLESTTYPGTTEEMLLPLLAAGGWRVGTDFFLAFSPERIDPGRRDFMMHNTPRVVGCVTRACGEAAAAVYGAAIPSIVPVANARTAEMVKLLENTFRSVNIALVNEVAMMCDRLDIPVFEVIQAAATKPFGFMPFYPGPGLGGHCVPIDPLYLSWKMRSLDYRARFIELAEDVNRSMPHYVAAKVCAALNRHRKAVRGSRVLVLGVAYKRDIDDVRESPAFDVMRALEKQGAEVSYHDPFVPLLEHEGAQRRSVPLERAVLAAVDCAVIVTDHSAVDYAELVRSVPVVVDARDATRHCRHLGDVVTI